MAKNKKRKVARTLQKVAAGVKSKQKEVETEVKLPPIPKSAFPYYSTTSSTPLPPPSMPKRPFLSGGTKILLVAVGAYTYLKASKKETPRNKEIQIEETYVYSS